MQLQARIRQELSATPRSWDMTTCNRKRVSETPETQEHRESGELTGRLGPLPLSVPDASFCSDFVFRKALYQFSSFATLVLTWESTLLSCLFIMRIQRSVLGHPLYCNYNACTLVSFVPIFWLLLNSYCTLPAKSLLEYCTFMAFLVEPLFAGKAGACPLQQVLLCS